MKVTCNIIKDLIVLKETDSISDDSMELVNNHLSECECCRKYEADLKASQEIFDEVQTNKINIILNPVCKIPNLTHICCM